MDFRSAGDIADFRQGDEAFHDMRAIEGAGRVLDARGAVNGIRVDASCVAVAGQRDEAVGVAELEGLEFEV